jgi:hypothetical protein
VGLSPAEDYTSWEFESPSQHFVKKTAIHSYLDKYSPHMAVLVNIRKKIIRS